MLDPHKILLVISTEFGCHENSKKRILLLDSGIGRFHEWISMLSWTLESRECLLCQKEHCRKKAEWECGFRVERIEHSRVTESWRQRTSELGGSGELSSSTISFRICLQCRRPGFDPWVGQIPWRRGWLLTPVFLPGEFREQRSLAAWGSQRVAHDWVTNTLTAFHMF